MERDERRPRLKGLGATGRELLESTLWTTTGLSAGAALLWAGLPYVVSAGYELPAPVHGGDDVQVCIPTVDAESVVQATVQLGRGHRNRSHPDVPTPRR